MSYNNGPGKTNKIYGSYSPNYFYTVVAMGTESYVPCGQLCACVCVCDG